MGTEIDRLEIEIISSASKTNQSLDEMIARLMKICAALESGTVNAKSFDKNMNRAANAMLKSASNAGNYSTQIMRTFTSNMTKSYYAVRALTRAISEVKNSAQNAMDYIETSNFSNVILDKISTEFKGDWSKLGYDSASAYVDSMANRLHSTLTKLTGYKVGENGEALITDLPNLGMNIESMMAFQTRIAAITNSVGLLGETSIDAATSLTMLVSDMASLTNTDLNTVMTNFSSGIIGQSRALYKYGIDITNATLQTYAYELGLKKAVSEMTQAEKMQLRMLAILDQSKVAWGDMANTLDSVSNMYRVTNEQGENLSRTFGNLLLPIVKEALPVVNGMIISMNRLLTSFGYSLYGDNWLSDLQDGISDGYVDGSFMEGLEEDATATTEAIEEFKGAIRGFDELNLINSKGASIIAGIDPDSIDLSTEISNAVAEYESVWEEAFADLENKAEEYANKITPALEGVVDTIGAISPALQVAAGAFVGIKLTKAISTFGDIFDNAKGKVSDFIDKIKDTGQKLDFDSVTGAFRDSMSPAAKIATGLVALVGNFQGISDGVYDIATGTDDVIENIGQMAVAAGASAAAMYIAFGPAGVAAAAVTGLVGAISGINNAMDEIVAESIGNSIKDALTNPGGTPLSELTGDFKESLQEAGDGFLTITNKSKTLSTADVNIRNTWGEIENIQTAMDNGVLSVEDGVKELERLFGELATLAETKFEAMSETILSALGESGAFRNAMLALGAPIEDGIDLIVDYGYTNGERVKGIIEEMTKVSYGTEKYKELQKELYSLTTGYDDVAKASSDFSYSLSQIDFSEVLNEDGLDADALNKILDSCANAFDDYISSVDDAAKELRGIYDEVLSSKYTSEAEKAVAEQMISYIEQSVSMVTADEKQEMMDLLNTVQNELASEIVDVIENAKSQWSEFGYWKKVGLSYKGIDSEGDYIKEQLKQFEEQFDMVSDEIESFSKKFNLNLEKIDMSTMLDNIFTWRNVGNYGLAYDLVDEWKEIIEDSLEEPLSEGGASSAQNFTTGFEKGIEENIPRMSTFMDWYGKTILKGFNESLGIHSPSDMTEESAMFFIKGFTGGLDANSHEIIEAILALGDMIQETLDSMEFTFPAIEVPEISYGSYGINSELSSTRNAVASSAYNEKKNSDSQTGTSTKKLELAVNLDKKTIYRAVVDCDKEQIERTGQSGFAY